MSTYYELLGVEKDATEEQIKTRYKELVRKYHPDVAEDKAIAHEIFIKLTEAYDVLTDPEKRARYDAGYDVSPEPKTQTSSYSSDPGYSRDYSSYSYSSYSSYDDDDDDDYDEDDEEDEDEEEKDDDEEYCARHIFYNGLSDEFRLSALKKWGAAKFSLAWLKFRTYEVLKADTSRIYERYEYYRDAWKAAYEAVQSFEYALRIDTDSEILKRNLAKAEYILFLCSTKPSAEDSQKAYNLFKEYFNENFIEESKQDKGFPEDATYLGEMFHMAEHLRESEDSSLAYPMYEDIVSYIEKLPPEKIEAEKVSVLSGLNNILRVYDNDEQISPEESARVRELISRIDPEYFTRTAREEAAKNRAETAENCMWCCGCLVFFIICFLICLVGCI